MYGEKISGTTTSAILVSAISLVSDHAEAGVAWRTGGGLRERYARPGSASAWRRRARSGFSRHNRVASFKL
jgi:hypothetical protein